MRYLLEKDNQTFKRLCNLKDKYFDYRQPNKLIGGVDAQMQINIRDINYDVQSYNMMIEEKIDIDRYIEMRISKQRDDLVLNEFDIQFAMNPDYYFVRAAYYYASPTYLKVLNSIEYFDKLKLKAHSWLLPLAKMDVRNLVIQNGYLMLGKRGRNEFDAYLLGDFISFTKLMTIEEYDKQLKLFKDEI
jgi:hypothetical protein